MYSTYLGGNNYDVCRAIAVDTAGCAYLTGFTYSSDFPIQSPYDSSFNGGNYDAFVAKLSVSGGALVYSTYLGGGGNDDGLGIAVDNAGCAYLSGSTRSSDFPMQNPNDGSFNGGDCDAFVTKLSASNDADGDEVLDSVDNCPAEPNPDQSDTEQDGIGDVCDNCPTMSNPDQADSDQNGIGNACTFSSSTPEGNNVNIDLGSNVHLFFDHVNQSGTTVMTITITGPIATSFIIVPYNQPTYYNITTDALFTDSIEICINYNQSAINSQIEPNLKMQHYAGDMWTDITISLDTVTNLICGKTTSLSPFVLAVPSICGDANGNGAVNILDVSFIINYLYKHGPAPNPLQSADVNHSGGVNILDVSYLINYLYKQGPALNCP